jgi:formate-dependent nitrite reductase membrane component NrfD
MSGGDGQADEGRYYGRQLLKSPVWKPEIAWYFWLGGLTGASSVLALAARRTGNRRLCRSALLGAFIGSLVSPLLLIDDLGRPERFLNMLRVLKPTSPMSVGSWTLAGVGTAVGGALFSELSGALRPLGRLAELAAAALGPWLATYTAVLVSDTAIPVWHQARRHLPFVFAGGAMASAGSFAAAVTPAGSARPARRLALVGAAVEACATEAMLSHLGALARPYRDGPAADATRLARSLALAGGATMLLAGRRRWGAALGGAMLMGGALATRVAVLRAGLQGAAESGGLAG